MRLRQTESLVGAVLTPLAADAVRFLATAWRDAVIADAGQLVMGPHRPRRQWPPVTSALGPVRNVVVMHQTSDPLDGRLIAPFRQSGVSGDREQIGPVDDVPQITVSEMAVEHHKEVEIVRRAGHAHDGAARAGRVWGSFAGLTNAAECAPVC